MNSNTSDPPEPSATPSDSSPGNDFEASFQKEVNVPQLEFDTLELDYMLTHTSGPQIFRAIVHYYYQRELTQNGTQELPLIRAGAVLTPADYPLQSNHTKPIHHLGHQRFFDLDLLPEPLDAGENTIEWIKINRDHTDLLDRDELDLSDIFST
ncbi:MAG: hypothetical protein ACSHYB_05270 [Roseibacillus sp.]